MDRTIGESEWVLCASNIPDTLFLAYREWIYLDLRTHTFTDHASIPFFFEPNFDTKVAPLEAARRIQTELSLNTERLRSSKLAQKKIYEPVVYGDFLREKVRNNFDHDGGKHN